MSKRYSIAEARSNLATIVDQAEAGQAVELTRRGKPVAVIISLHDMERLRGERARFGERYQHFLATHALPEIGIEGGYFESTRTREAGRKVVL